MQLNVRKKKGKQVGVRVTAEEYKAILRVAKKLDVSATEAARAFLTLGLAFYSHGRYGV